MNLQNYLKHADGCPQNKQRCANCSYPHGEHFTSGECPYKRGSVYVESVCICDYASIQSSLVLLPDGLKEKIVEVMKRGVTHHKFDMKNDTACSFIHSDNFNTVAEDIVKAVKGEGK